MVALAQPRRRGLGRSHTVALLVFCCVAGVPVGAGGTLLGHQGKPGAAEDLLNATRSSGAPAAGKTWSYQNGTGLGGDRAVGGFAACPAFRCGAWVLLQAAAGGVGLPGLPAAAAGWVALETLRPAVRCVGQALLAGLHPSNLRLLSRPAPGAAPVTLLCLPLSRSLAWKAELLAAKAGVLPDAGVDVVGESTVSTGHGKATRLVILGRDRRLDPYRGVRVGEASHPGPDRTGKAGKAGKGSEGTPPPPLKPPDHFSTLGVARAANAQAVKAAYRAKVLKDHPDKKGGDK